jgi:hypothetical protein
MKGSEKKSSSRSEKLRRSPREWKTKSKTRLTALSKAPWQSKIAFRKHVVDKSKDQDRGKGAMEQDQQNEGGNTSMQGQLGHRDQDAELKNGDADLSG